ncbi:hypothetical protein [Mongoliitalea daihaiensis]|uniref:hypothetical protein n=1 Tax=Mongoliitalea daihaiensis TaxID=2782006 RepID=UPI001F373F8B|nr:hypothetical protein [Mongoliitalea daihaiensis]UJP63975.1 hypothetical protein IPZ59_14245 [Mongoliitalea daihaiensis]
MLTTKELRDLYLSIEEKDSDGAMFFIAQHFDDSYCLLDEDGFSITIFYGKLNAAIYYENRHSEESFLDFLGVVDARLELIVFLGRILQLYGHDLSDFEEQMKAEAEILFRRLNID